MVAMGEPIGREDELAALERFVVGDGSGALLLEGPAGIGKTTLWEHSIELAVHKGVRVLATRAADGEAALGYAGLGDLLAGLDEVVQSLPPPQREAIETALLLRTGAALDRGAVALGTAGVLRKLGEEGPVLVALDDVQWLDEPSAAALAFAVRRVRTTRLLIAARQGEEWELRRALERTALERLAVGPLDPPGIRHLLHERLGLRLPRRLTQQIVHASQGNPLFALELGRAVQESGEASLSADLPLPATVEELLARRVASLEPAVRRLLLVATLAPGLDASQLPGREAAGDALEAAVLTLDGDRLRPAHPLLGAAALARARPGELRNLHRELAAVAGDEEQRCHHLARATLLPDAELADRVAAAAARAGTRGAALAAAELATEALRLTGGTDQSSARTCAANWAVSLPRS
jgi:hypothetical protein